MSGPVIGVVRYRDATAFLTAAGTFLLSAESENNLILGIALELADRGPLPESPTYFAAVYRGERLEGCAFSSVPDRLGITGMRGDVIGSLASDAGMVCREVTSVGGPDPAVAPFAAGFADLSSNALGSVAMAAFGGAVIAQTLDVLFAAVTIKVRGRGRVRDALGTIAPIVLAAVPLYAPVVVVLALAYEQLSPWTLLLFFAPALAAQRFFALYQDQRRLSDGFASANARLERANLSFAAGLVATLDARDRYTAGHSAAVAIYSRDIARRMGLSAADQQRAHLCGLVHDIGKIGLPPGLLEKPGALTLDERRQMQEHAAIGERILEKVEGYAEIAKIVRHHHERIDGHGYPDGLVEDDIPLLSRIIAVADAYNAMTSDRPYRESMPSRVARLRMAQAVETQFDTAVVAAFEAILAGNDEIYRSATGESFRVKARDERHVQPLVSVA